jgi:Zn-dependent peptidase ImmA (M78 family)
MKLPLTVQVGAIDYTIRQVPPPVDPDNRELLGTCDHTEGLILIDANLSRQQKNETLWHELVHAINCQYFNQHLFAENETENNVAVVARALNQIMRGLGLWID